MPKYEILKNGDHYFDLDDKERAEAIVSNMNIVDVYNVYTIVENPKEQET